MIATLALLAGLLAPAKDPPTCELSIPSTAAVARLRDLTLRLGLRNDTTAPIQVSVPRGSAVGTEGVMEAVASSLLFELTLTRADGAPVAIPEHRVIDAPGVIGAITATATVPITLEPGGASGWTVSLARWVGWGSIDPEPGEYGLQATYTGGDRGETARSSRVRFRVVGARGTAAAGESLRGLRASLELPTTEGAASFAHRQAITPLFAVANTSDHPVSFETPEVREDGQPILVPPAQGGAWHATTTWYRHVRWVLEPGERIVLAGAAFAFLPPGSTEESVPAANSVAAAAGAYRIAFDLGLARGSGTARPGEFEGVLRTGEAAVTVRGE